jgi:NAD dependent epimerase/dehydratase family enzyme
MNMKVAIAGSTGMIGNLVQAICLDHEDITEVSSLVRKPTWTQHDKLTETVIEDFEDYSGHDEVFKDVGVGFFCIGAYTGQVPDDLFKKIRWTTR